METSNELAQDRTDLATDRTLLAHERTLMAWTRTATSLISFGFSIHTFFRNFAKGEDRPDRLFGASNFALLMITIGLVCLVLASLRHWHDLQQMHREYGAKPRYLPLVLAGLIAFLGVVGFSSVAFHL